MTTESYSQVQLDIKLKEYDHLKNEIQNRLRTAFSHVAFAGAIIAFAIPSAERALPYQGWALLLAIIGTLALCWVATLNMYWVQHLGNYLKNLEEELNNSFNPRVTVLGWETYASDVQARKWFLLPSSPNIPKAPSRHPPVPEDSSSKE
ncbi:hypothetical protein [Pseudomonas halotolerans]|uniref:hypothetical protein n=1 Tax=Pseudomonas halotolerans TaxID=3143552 RepID=UPI0031E0F653